MATDGMGVLRSDQKIVSYTINVNLNHPMSEDGVPSLFADAEVTIGGVTVWAGLVTWQGDTDDEARRAAAHEALMRWTDRW